MFLGFVSKGSAAGEGYAARLRVLHLTALSFAPGSSTSNLAVSPSRVSSFDDYAFAIGLAQAQDIARIVAPAVPHAAGAVLYKHSPELER